jgi:tetratricopeptide (TPR) repeat protein
MAMLDYYNMQGMDSLYTTTRDSILFSPSTDSQKRARLMENIIESSPEDSASTEAIMMRFNRILEVVPNDVQMLMLNAIYMEYRKFPPADIALVMQRVLDVQPDQETAMRWLAQYHIAQRDLSAMEEICRRGVNYYPSNLTYYYFLALPLMNSGNYEETIETLTRGLRLRAEDTKAEIISDVYTQKGDCYYEMGKHEEAFLQYDSALVYNKDNVLCLNNYAYFLSLQNKDLGKAEEMSYRAIKLEPNNRTYLDTYAWILFMQEQYAEAERYMERVVPRDSSEHYLLTDDYTGSAILEHAGDIAWMNGDTQRAIYLWQLAVKRGDADVTPLLPKKARKKKYYK